MLVIVGKLTLMVVMIFALSEVAKRSPLLASLLASLPVTTILAATVLYWETQDNERVASFTNGVMWLILPSFVFFVLFPFLLRRGMSYTPALAIGVASMLVFYGFYAFILRWFSIKL